MITDDDILDVITQVCSKPLDASLEGQLFPSILLQRSNKFVLRGDCESRHAWVSPESCRLYHAVSENSLVPLSYPLTPVGFGMTGSVKTRVQAR